MRGRHWERLSSAMGTRVHPGSDSETNLQKLLSVGITQHAELLQVGRLDGRLTLAQAPVSKHQHTHKHYGRTDGCAVL